MRVENPACVYTRGRSRKSVSFIAIFALAVLAATALVVGVQHPTVALAGGAGSVRLRNNNGVITNVVILQLSGPKVGVEFSVAAAGVSIRLK